MGFSVNHDDITIPDIIFLVKITEKNLKEIYTDGILIEYILEQRSANDIINILEKVEIPKNDKIWIDIAILYQYTSIDIYAIKNGELDYLKRLKIFIEISNTYGCPNSRVRFNLDYIKCLELKEIDIEKYIMINDNGLLANELWSEYSLNRLNPDFLDEKIHKNILSFFYKYKYPNGFHQSFYDGKITIKLFYYMYKKFYFTKRDITVEFIKNLLKYQQINILIRLKQYDIVDPMMIFNEKEKQDFFKAVKNLKYSI